MTKTENWEKILKSVSENFDAFLKEVSKIAKCIEIGERHSVQITEPDGRSHYAEKEYYIKIQFKIESHLPEKIERNEEKTDEEGVFSID